MTDAPHMPVLIDKIMDFIDKDQKGLIIDATFGAGGYTQKLLEGSSFNVLAIDQDNSVKQYSDEIKKQYSKRFNIVFDNFSNIDQIIQSHELEMLDGIIADIGVSSMQIDQAIRGFSFKNNGPLDMRMSTDNITAEEVVNTYDEQELANIIYKYGEEPKSRKIARFICKARIEDKIDTTFKLKEIIHSAIGNKGKTDSATKTFQALRIYVNQELDCLKSLLKKSVKYLKPKGKLILVTFHSLEDRIVKNFFKKYSGNESNSSRYLPEIDKSSIYFEKNMPNSIKPSKNEIETNIRARSAKLRIAVRNNNEFVGYDD